MTTSVSFPRRTQGPPSLLLIITFLFICLSISTGHEDTSKKLPSFPTAVEDPKLSGHHFRITAIERSGYIDIQEEQNGQLRFSGYLIDILKELSFRANFTYELLTPSGYGSHCKPRLAFPKNTTLQTASSTQQLHHSDAYHRRYRKAYKCGESDVNDRPVTEYSTDMFVGLFYITPERLKINRFTLPYSPPGSSATLGMFGHATHINSIHDLPGTDYAVCAYKGTAYFDNLVLSFPELQLTAVSLEDDDHTLLSDGTCDVIINVFSLAKQRVLELYKNGKCTANGKPIGVIGEPLEYGLNYMAFGVRMDLPETVVQALNFWMQALMSCFPQDPNGYCPNGVGSFSELYAMQLGSGDECGYVQFPVDEADEGLRAGGIAAIAIVPIILVVALGMVLHIRQLRRQEKRMKKRFIQQLARNIDIGPSARQLSAEKLSEAFQHIGGQDNLICKQDLAKWMNDLNLDFLSEQDFDRLWGAMDIDQTGFVDPIEFYHFLSECEKQFKEVHTEYSALPKSEKVKLASRRLSNIKAMGQEEVERMERRNNRRGRMIPISPSALNMMNNSSTADCSENSQAHSRR